MIRLETHTHDDDNLVEEVLFDLMNPLKPTIMLTWQQAHKTCMVHDDSQTCQFKPLAYESIEQPLFVAFGVYDLQKVKLTPTKNIKKKLIV